MLKFLVDIYGYLKSLIHILKRKLLLPGYSNLLKSLRYRLQIFVPILEEYLLAMDPVSCTSSFFAVGIPLKVYKYLSLTVDLLLSAEKALNALQVEQTQAFSV